MVLSVCSLFFYDGVACGRLCVFSLWHVHCLTGLLKFGKILEQVSCIIAMPHILLTKKLSHKLRNKEKKKLPSLQFMHSIVTMKARKAAFLEPYKARALKRLFCRNLGVGIDIVSCKPKISFFCVMQIKNYQKYLNLSEDRIQVICVAGKCSTTQLHVCLQVQ